MDDAARPDGHPAGPCPPAAPATDRVRFTQSDLEAFSAASHDANPIHMDPAHARRTPYGERLVFGSLAALACLARLHCRSRGRLARLRVEFCRPLLLDADYELRTTETDGGADAELCDGDLVMLRLRARFGANAPPATPAQAKPPPGSPAHTSNAAIGLRSEPRDRDENELGALPRVAGVYGSSRSAARERGVSGTLAPLHTDVLMLCSYLAGMELPGLRSLLYRLDIEFGASLDGAASLRFDARAHRYEPAYGLMEIDLEVCAGDAVAARGRIDVLVPRRIGRADSERVRALLHSPRGALSGRVALVTGGSRGLGAAFVQALALQGCDVVVSYLSCTAQAEALAADLADAPGSVSLLPGDASSAAWCEHAREWLSTRHGGLDYLICNACAPPLELGGSGSSRARMQRYHDRNLALATTPVEFLTGLVESRRGVIATVSSGIVDSGTRHWAHYAHMKRAVEAALGETSARHPELGALVIRPPALLTDMSNTPGRAFGALSPETVAAALADRLARGVPPGGVETLSEFVSGSGQPDGAAPGPAAVRRPAARETSEAEAAEAQAQARPQASEKIVIAASFSANPLVPAVDWWTAALGWRVGATLAPYQQLYQELLNPLSALGSNPGGLNVVALRVGDWLRALPESSPDAAARFLRRALDELVDALGAYGARRQGPTLMLLCPESERHEKAGPWRDVLESAARRLAHAAEGLSAVDVVWARDHHASYRVAEGSYRDDVSEEVGHVPYTLDYYAFLATLIVRRFHARKSRPYKAIAVDCDNTLWRGVCAEDGAGGVEIDAAASVLQRFLANQKRQGMLLCLCSKNDEADVERVFDSHPGMLLERADFVDARIGWQAKSGSLESLAGALGIGLDSFVFLDDNPVECAEVAARCPEVLALRVPASPGELSRLLEHTWAFDHLDVTREDGLRTELYRAQAERRELRAASRDFKTFLDGLELEVEFEPAGLRDARRIAQLTRRTNQFNFTTIRRSEEEIAQLVEDPSYDCRAVRARDRFGDYGLVGVVILRDEEGAIAVESCMLSCRVLGRGVEHRVFARIGALARERPVATVCIAFTQSARNRPAALFLDEISAAACGERGPDSRLRFTAAALEQLELEPGGADSHGDGPGGAPAPAAALGEPARAQPALTLELTEPGELAKRMRDVQAENAPGASPAIDEHAKDLPANGSTRAGILDDVQALFAVTLNLDANRLDADAALETYVTDSMQNVMLTVELERRYPGIPRTLLFEHGTLRSLAESLAADYGARPRAAEDAPAPAAAPATREAAPRAGAGPQSRGIARAGDIAIIGINGRFPGAPDLQAFWRNLCAGTSSLSAVPRDRWEVDAFYDPDGRPDATYCDRGGFIEDVDRFDAALFRISPREAALMDPQQRLFLEVVWGLLEDAGYTRGTIARDTGVFVGSNASDYAAYANALALEGASAYRNADDFQIPNRISYHFDLHGPSVCLDTACSSSGTAVFLACQSLTNRQCRMAIAGGVNLFLHPSRFIQYAQMHMISPSGRLSPFGAGADGTVFGEGVGALLLKPLADAERDGDHIHAVIKGCAVNAGGKTNGFTVPNPQAHAELVSQALRQAATDPRTITYVEAHGTGTPLGDPIEVRGLTMAFEHSYAGADAGTQFCALGSVKANIGHLEACAAIPGIIKIVLQMKHAILVPSLNARELNPSIAFETSPFYVPQTASHWPRPTGAQDGGVETCPRRAGISSFGAGGSNAHIILEEYPPAAPRAPSGTAPELVLLSAASRQALESRAAGLAAFLDEAGKGDAAGGAARLADIAYTLRAGREAMNERLALVVSTRGELAEKLSAWRAQPDDTSGQGRQAPARVWYGNAKQGRAQAELLLGGPEGEAFVRSLAARRRLDELARIWVQGVSVDWSALDAADGAAQSAAAPRRVPLPGYRFEGDRYWLPGRPNMALASARGRGTSPHHPLLDGIHAGMSAGEGLVFRKTLTARLPVVRDHVVSAQCLMPGAGCLEMACAAIEALGEGGVHELEDVVWPQPLAIGDEPAQVLVALARRPDGVLGFEVRSRTAGDCDADDCGRTDGQRDIVHASGTSRRGAGEAPPAEERVAHEPVRERCPDPLDADAIYAQFQSIGIDYGPYFRMLTRIHLGRDEALGVVCVPPDFAHELDRYTLFPPVVDAALQTALILTRGDCEGRAALPFSAGRIRIGRAPGPEAFVHARRTRAGLVQATVLDPSGRVCLRIDDLCLRPLRDSLERLFYTPRWKPAPPAPAHRQDAPVGDVVIVHAREAAALADALAAQHAHANVHRLELPAPNGAGTARAADLLQRLAEPRRIGRLYFLGGLTYASAPADDHEALALAQEAGALALFRLIKALAGRGAVDRPLDLFVITNDVHRVCRGERTCPQSAGVLGLAGVAAREFPRLRVRCLDLSLEDVRAALAAGNAEDLLRPVLDEPQGDGGVTVLRRGRRYVQTLEPTQLPPVRETPFEQGGVYLILGGAGGLGFELSRHLAETVQAKLVWIGRSELDAAKRDKLAEIESLGGEALYVQADACDAPAMRRAVGEARARFGPIRGAVHSAIVLNDRTLSNMDEAGFNAAYAPKVLGCAALYRALKHEPLDFLLLFSSANSFMGSKGQSNYVAGCRFKDAFGLHLNELESFPTRVINWGYWGSTGVVSGEDYQRRITAQGHRSIEPREGIEAIRRVLSAPCEQVLAMKAEPDVLGALGVDAAAEIALYPPQPLLGSERLLEAEAGLALDAGYAHRFAAAFRRMEALARRWLSSALASLGLPLAPDRSHSREALRARLGIADAYVRLFDAVLDLMLRDGLLRRTGEALAPTAELASAASAGAPDAYERQLLDLAKECPEIAERVPLLTVCLRALPDLLASRAGHMEIMFPGGALDLVERIYRGNRVTDHFNEQLARIVEARVRQCADAGPDARVQILELGAGTGASSAALLARLGADVANLGYVYTDISRRFIRHGETRFADTYPFVDFRLLDMEAAPEEQGFTPGVFDVVVGTNCVHATRDICATVQRLKRLLKTGGLLVLNETVERLDYNTLTFGLTGGWWLFEDDAFRIPGSPLLERESWRHVLEGSGIGPVHFVEAGGHADGRLGQCLIVGESDGRVVRERTTVAAETAAPAGVTAPPAESTANSTGHRPAAGAAPVGARPEDAAAETAGPAADDIGALTVAHVKKVMAAVINMKAEDMDARATFDEYGVDSLIALEVIERLEKDVGALPATLLFEHPTVEALAGHLVAEKPSQLAKRLTPRAAPAVVRRSETPSDLPAPAAVPEPDPGSVPAETVADAASVATPPARATAVWPAAPAPASADEPIAIVGIAGRYPMADSLDQFWDNLVAGRNCVTEIPPERWSAHAHYAPGNGDDGGSHSKWGGFIDDADKFDALFFNISPKDARQMSPEERLFLEIVWQAVESAGYTRRQLARMQQRHGKGVGVFAGCMYQQYPFLDPDPDSGALLSAASYWSLANRVSYFFDFKGPSLALDTACASSLTAIHLACESIRHGESCMAVAGGVNLSLHPSKYRRLQQCGMLASTAESKSLGDGDGLVPGEGVGAALLAPLSFALDEGATVHGLIRCTAINHGGKTGGFTVPNPNAQAELIAGALERARIDSRTIGYVEVAANGSALGDPIEVAGLTKAFRRCSGDEGAGGAPGAGGGACAIGAVKSNVGHLEAAAGIAQLTKVLLQLEHRTLVPSINADPPNPHLDLETTPFHVQQSAGPWEPGRVESAGAAIACPRRAAISSFGAGGAYAHVVVEEHIDARHAAADGPAGGPHLVVLSAKTPDRLKARADSLLTHLRRRRRMRPAAQADCQLRERVLADLLGLAAQTLDVQANDLDTDAYLPDYGMDAMAYTALTRRLNEQYGIGVSPNALAAAGDLVSVADELLRVHEGALVRCYASGARQAASSRRDDGECEATLADIAYTLQVGREPMAARLAAVVADEAALLGVLEAYARGEEPAGRFHVGQLSATGPGAVSRPNAGEAEPDVAGLLEGRRLTALAELWVNGVDVDWPRLKPAAGSGAEPGRVRLPGYPFERTRHWVADSSPAPAPRNGAASRERAPSPAPRPGPRDAETGALRAFEDDLERLVCDQLEIGAGEIDRDEALRAYGLDSVGLAAVAQRVCTSFGIEVPLGVFFGYPSIAACANGLWSSHESAISRFYARGNGDTAAAPPARATGERAAGPAVTYHPQGPAWKDPGPDRVPVAIIGAAGRMPGSSSIDSFFADLMAGRELITEVPAQRWRWRDHYGDPQRDGNKTRCRWGGFIDDVDKFDSQFFGIAPREAQTMDPRQRLLLETVWSAIENAGYAPDALGGSNTGLFVGVGNNDYAQLMRSAGVELTAHASTGLMVNSILASRVSYLMDLHGPSEIVDTACSSSTAALHRAARALQSGECGLAIAGGVNVLLDPQGFVILDKAGVLSEDGRIRLFTESATGYVRGEGVGAVLLKRLPEAVADRDHIHGVIIGSAINHDGKSYSLTAPSPAAQSDVILSAHRETGIDPATLTYIEAQGTGTPLMDPLELEAFKSAFRVLYEGAGAVNGKPMCGIGYLKPNIGHLECASGIAALFKILWAFKTGHLPAAKNVDGQAMAEHLQHTPFYLVAASQAWESVPDRDGRPAPRRAGLNSFGFGGVNAHLVLEEYVN